MHSRNIGIGIFFIANVFFLALVVTSNTSNTWFASVGTDIVRAQTLVMMFADSELAYFNVSMITLQNVYRGDVIILRSAGGKDDEVHDMCQRPNTRCKQLPASTDSTIQSVRYVEYAKQCAGYEACLVLEDAGMFFQADPFAVPLENDLVLAAETTLNAANITKLNCPIARLPNATSDTVFDGISVTDFFFDGVIIGTPYGFEALKTAILETSQGVELGNCSPSLQNCLTHLHRSHSSPLRIMLRPSGFGMIYTVKFTPSWHKSIKASFDTEGYVVNEDGTVPSVVKHDDRMPEMNLLVGKLLAGELSGRARKGIGAEYNNYSPCRADAECWRQENNVTENIGCARVLEKLNRWSNLVGIPYTISNGVLLGWWRQCSCIPNSQDVDIMIAYEDIKERIGDLLAVGEIIWIDKEKKLPSVVKVPRYNRWQLGTFVDIKIVYHSDWLDVDWVVHGDQRTTGATWDPRSFSWAYLHGVPIRVPASPIAIQNEIYNLYGTQWNTSLVWELAAKMPSNKIKMETFGSNDIIDVFDVRTEVMDSRNWGKDPLRHMILDHGVCFNSADSERTACINSAYAGSRGGAAKHFPIQVPHCAATGTWCALACRVNLFKSSCSRGEQLRRVRAELFAAKKNSLEDAKTDYLALKKLVDGQGETLAELQRQVAEAIGTRQNAIKPF